MIDKTDGIMIEDNIMKEIFPVTKLSDMELDKLTEFQQKNLTMQCWQSIPQAKQMELERTMFCSKKWDEWDYKIYLMERDLDKV